MRLCEDKWNSKKLTYSCLPRLKYVACLSSLKRPDLDDARRDYSLGVDFILSLVLDHCSTRTADSEEEKYQPLYHVPQTPLTQLNRIELNISE